MGRSVASRLAVQVLLAGTAAAPNSAALAAEPAEFARYLASLGLHRAAVAELNKADLQGQPQWLAPGVGVPYALTLLADRQPAEAAEVMEGVLSSASPADAAEYAVTEALVLEANGHHAAAIARLGRAEAFSDTAAGRLRAGRLRCALHLRAVEVEASGACVTHWLAPASRRRAVAQLKRSSNAGWWRGALLSAVVPGLGQALGGEPLDAAAALGVNGALWTLTVDLYASGLVLDGSLLLIGMTSRYYAGNIQHGARAMGRAVQREQKSAADQLLQQLVALPEDASPIE